MITCTEPLVAPNGRYPMGEAARLLGVHRNTLRMYCDAGHIKCGYRRHGRHDRFILGREILRFWKAQW